MSTIQLGKNCFLDLDNDLLIKGSSEIPLSRMQVHVLQKLGENLGSPVSSQELIATAWGAKGIAFVPKSELYVVIHRLRQRLEEHADHLICIKGFGYLLRPLDIDTG